MGKMTNGQIPTTNAKLIGYWCLVIGALQHRRRRIVNDRSFVLVRERLMRFFPGIVAGQGTALFELAAARAGFLQRGPADISPQLLLRAERRHELSRYAFFGAVEVMHSSAS